MLNPGEALRTYTRQNAERTKLLICEYFSLCQARIPPLLPQKAGRLIRLQQGAKRHPLRDVVRSSAGPARVDIPASAMVLQ
jgi:hypothetical protein